MDRKILFEDLNITLNELKQLIGKIQPAVYISKIEIDLMKEKCRNLYDLLLKLEKLPEENMVGSEKSEEVEAIDEKTRVQTSESHESAIIDEGPLIGDEKIEIPLAPKTGTTEKTESQKFDLFSTTADSPLRKHEVTVKDKIAEKKSEVSIADKIKKSGKITGLKQVIGINEKFFFINELFKGNMKDYNETIENLDKCSSLEDAHNLLESLEGNFGWKEDSEAHQQLVEIVERKFS
ncbi:MAG: hypothetical protein JW731_11810 [Bacteroidales bacterium]|nr:hypothetical protein [Bacteroidales bacterium]